MVWVFFVSFVALPYHTEMIQGYHLLHQLTHFTHELEPVTLLFCLCGLFFGLFWLFQHADNTFSLTVLTGLYHSPVCNSMRYLRVTNVYPA